MNRMRALRVGFAIFGAVVVASYLGLRAIDVKEEVFTTALILIGCAGSYLLSRVALHYAPPDERGR